MWTDKPKSHGLPKTYISVGISSPLDMHPTINMADIYPPDVFLTDTNAGDKDKGTNANGRYCLVNSQLATETDDLPNHSDAAFDNSDYVASQKTPKDIFRNSQSISQYQNHYPERKTPPPEPIPSEGVSFTSVELCDNPDSEVGTLPNSSGTIAAPRDVTLVRDQVSTKKKRSMDVSLSLLLRHQI
jgi:hypothetical protein